MAPIWGATRIPGLLGSANAEQEQIFMIFSKDLGKHGWKNVASPTKYIQILRIIPGKPWVNFNGGIYRLISTSSKEEKYDDLFEGV